MPRMMVSRRRDDRDIIAALRIMHVRTRVSVESAAVESASTPG
jgi:hypothetical protein